MAKAGKLDKVVRREICQITTRGTKINESSGSNYLTAICGQKSINEGQITVGVCFVDTSMGMVHLSQFEDDKQLSCLETLLAFYPPIGEWLYSKHRINFVCRKGEIVPTLSMLYRGFTFCSLLSYVTYTNLFRCLILNPSIMYFQPSNSINLVT